MDVKPFQYWRDKREWKNKVKATRRNLIPLDGSLRWVWRNRGGQDWRYYLKDLLSRCKFCYKTTRDRIVWGSAITDYYDLDYTTLQFLRNGIISLSKLTMSTPADSTEEDWSIELNKALTLLNAYLDDNDEEAYKAFMEWLPTHLRWLWD